MVEGVSLGPHCSAVKPLQCVMNFTILQNKTSLALGALRAYVCTSEHVYFLLC